jgi:hypothetical protein
MSVLDGAALGSIFLTIVAIAAAIVATGSLPGKIALKRGHPYPDAVNAASWIGLATGVFWPVAFIWAFLPVPVKRGEASVEASSVGADLTAIQQRLEALETETERAKRQSQPSGDSA